MFRASDSSIGARHVAGLVAAAVATMGLGQRLMAQCSSYQITPTSGNSITPGVDDTGNHADDGTTYGLPLPFGFNFYGTTYNTFNVCSNGVVTFGNPTTSTYANVCPQTNQAAWGPAIFGFWDDLYTSGTANGQGVFTTTTGVSPNQNFYIEFRTQFCCSTAAPIVDFEVVLHESGGFDVIYTNPNFDPRVGGNSATIGAQDGNGNFQAYQCNTQFINDGDGLSFTCPSTYPASCSLALSPSTGATLDTFVASATVTPGVPAAPPYSVSLDANAVNGGTVTLYDDGDPAHGDAAAGDLVYSNMVTVGAGTPNGPAVLTSTVTQGDSQTSTCTATYNVATVALAGNGAATPNHGNPGDSTLLTVAVTPATGPASTGIVVTADVSSLGLTSSETLYDDGSHGDVTAGDNTFSLAVTTSGGLTQGVYTVPWTVNDDQARSASGSMTYAITPANDDCGGAIAATLGDNFFDNSAATTSTPAASCGLLGNDLWYTFTPASDGQLTVTTCNLTTADTALAIYSDCFTSLACNDDNCGLQSSVSTCVSAGVPVYLRVGGFNGRLWTGSFNVSLLAGANYSIAPATAPTCGGPGTSVTLTARSNSTGCPLPTLSGVTADCSALDAGTATLADDGLFPDVTAGDGTFTGSVVVGAAATGGTVTFNATFTDGGTASATTSYTVPGADDAGDLPADATPAPSSVSIIGVLADSSCGGNDADMYIIHMCDPANFSASCVGNGTTIDTQMFLFNMDGTGIVMDDDDPVTGDLQSHISNAFTSALPPGDYLLAITRYNRDPLDASGQAIWANTPFNVERAPDGPGSANPIASWTGTTAAGSYQIDLTGVSSTPCGPHCGSADFDCNGDVGTDADISAFFACLSGNCPPPPCTSSSDFDGDGNVGTDADISAFFRVLGGGNC